ncbi:hypothetical protein G6F65_017893 [Rhizopus arrhizus]|nr:hypothetical protein G6F24_015381 [Rhizopus arrhizus]KAG1252509.1 hypothetical protein G6F65_017893 [Rhizopus arrhizus]KAG1383927.1 hypothetical protein G6F59_017762 [Rhizopus arrhizus]
MRAAGNGHRVHAAGGNRGWPPRMGLPGDRQSGSAYRSTEPPARAVPGWLAAARVHDLRDAPQGGVRFRAAHYQDRKSAPGEGGRSCALPAGGRERGQQPLARWRGG